jgi:hypothetical protein
MKLVELRNLPAESGSALLPVRLGSRRCVDSLQQSPSGDRAAVAVPPDQDFFEDFARPIFHSGFDVEVPETKADVGAGRQESVSLLE